MKPDQNHQVKTERDSRNPDARPGDFGGFRNFRTEAERDSDEEVARVIARLGSLMDDATIGEAGAKMVSRQLHAYRQEARRRSQQPLNGRAAAAAPGSAIGKPSVRTRKP